MVILKRFIGLTSKVLFRIFINLDMILLLRFLYRSKVIILFYHGVSAHPEKEPSNADGKHVGLAKFERQMRYISRKYNPVSWKVAVELLKGERKYPLNAIVVTFDDGYHNNLDFAYPVAKKYKIPIIIFLATSYADKGNISGYLSWKEIEHMYADGVEFGAHTITHPYLSELHSPELDKEVAGSKKIIEAHLKMRVDTFVYPYGSFNKDSRLAVKNAGYSCALTTIYGVNNINNDIYKLKRIPVNNNFSFTYFVASLFPLFGNLIYNLYSKQNP